MTESSWSGTPLRPPPPPHLTAPPASIAASSSGQRPSRVGKLATAFTVLQLLASGVALLTLPLQLALHDDAEAYVAGAISFSDFEHETVGYLAVMLLSGALSVAAVVVLIIWTWRCAANLDWLRRDPSWKRGWGIGVWLLGGLTLGILPFLMLRELWKGSDPAVPRADPGWRGRSATPLLWVWLALSIVQTVATAIASRMFGTSIGFMSRGTDRLAESLNERQSALFTASVIGVALGIVLVVIVRGITALQVTSTGEA